MSNSFSARIERMKSRRKGTFDQLNVARESISMNRHGFNRHLRVI